MQVIRIETEKVRKEETNRFEEDLEDTTGLFVDETGDTLDTATTGKTTDSGLGDTCIELRNKVLMRRKRMKDIPWMLSRRILR